MALYLDSSAIVKLVVHEKETTALRRFLADHPIRVSSALSGLEVRRASLRDSWPDSVHRRALAVLSRLVLLAIDRETLESAAGLPPRNLRSLDAIHLATALRLGQELAGVLAYDERLAEAAAGAGLQVFAPR